jgi:hypothetical protein
MKANDIQIGGDHYKGSYQHWDFVDDTGIGYLLGCATKYISRWRNKNGIQDLEKAAHYITKYQEKYRYRNTDFQHWDRFIKPMCEEDSEIMLAIFKGHYDQARVLIRELIANEESKPSKNYIDPDNNYLRG